MEFVNSNKPLLRGARSERVEVDAGSHPARGRSRPGFSGAGRARARCAARPRRGIALGMGCLRRSSGVLALLTTLTTLALMSEGR